jgi:hypothetical protein
MRVMRVSSSPPPTRTGCSCTYIRRGTISRMTHRPVPYPGCYWPATTPRGLLTEYGSDRSLVVACRWAYPPESVGLLAFTQPLIPAGMMYTLVKPIRLARPAPRWHACQSGPEQ